MTTSVPRRLALAHNPWPSLARRFRSHSCRRFTTDSHTRSVSEPKQWRVLRLNVPILEQLRIEEALLRLSPHNHLIVNRHTGPPSVVLGISGRPELWTHCDRCERDGVVTIKRFTGGGTVYVDTNTLFLTFLVQKSSLPTIAPYPQSILEWAYHNYVPVFNDADTSTANDHESNNDSGFRLNANDFCFGYRKVAGNAQSITRNAWLHHTSWLWHSDKEAMHRYLTQPPVSRLPEYRRHREHKSFVTSLYQEWQPALPQSQTSSDAGDGLSVLSERVFQSLERQGWQLVADSMANIEPLLVQKHDRVTTLIDWDLERARIEREEANRSHPQLPSHARA